MEENDAQASKLQLQSSIRIGESLSQGVRDLIHHNSANSGNSRSEFHKSLTQSLQELSLRITQLSAAGNSKTSLGIDCQERRQLVQACRQALQEAISIRVKDDQEEAGLTNAMKGCMVALKAAEHVAIQDVVAARQPVLQTLAILEKTTNSERIVLNIKLLGMRLNQYVELCGRHVHDLFGPQRRARVQMHIFVIQKLLPYLVYSLENSINRPKNAYDRASRGNHCSRNLFLVFRKKFVSNLQYLIASSCTFRFLF